MKSKFAWLYSAAWIVFMALYSLMLLSTPGTTFAQALSASFFTTVPAAFMGLIVWRLTSRVPWTGENKARFIAIHTVAAVVYGGLWAGITVGQIALFAPRDVLEIFIKRALGWQSLMGLLMYAVIAGVAYVVQITERLAEQRMMASRAELMALRSQLNPHFLFNTLHSITSLARQDGAETERALVQFGSLLRYVLDSARRSGEDATLEEELAFVRGYLAIEKMRLGERLETSEDIDPESLECLVPVLTLQPIVENAVQHGISPRARGGRIAIKSRMEDGRLFLIVSDDGMGADPAKIASSNGYGLSLVERRLTTRYNSQASMNVETSQGNGMTVSLGIPVA